MKPICASSDLRERTSLRFELPHGATGLVPADGFAYRAGDGTVRAWLNACPHRLQPIDLGDGQLFNRAGEIECAAHGARFDAATGACVAGPCAGARLTALAAIECDGAVWIADSSAGGDDE